MNNAAAILSKSVMRRMRTIARFVLDMLLPMRHPYRSVRGKIMRVVLITTASTLLVTDITLLVHDLNSYRQSWAANFATEASMLSLSTAPALAFDDRQSALRDLSALKAHSAILAAALYLPNGKLYADYAQSKNTSPPQQLTNTNPATQISGQDIVVIQPIVQKGEWLGTVYLHGHYNIISITKAYAGIFAVITFIAMAVALALSRALQRAITDPLDAMSEVAQQIIQGREYSLRARKTSDDEVGVVVEAFNKMLDEIQFRTYSLEQSNLALKNEVAIRHAAETALARANTRLESTMAAAEIGSWVWDEETQQYICDRNLAALYGFDGQQEIHGDITLFTRFIHPDDLPALQYRQSQPIQSGSNPSTEFRIIRPDGSIRHVLTRSKAQVDGKGIPRLVAGLIIDISRQKQAEQALRESEALYRAIGESINYGVWLCDAEGRNTYASESFLQLAGMTQQQYSGSGWLTALHPDDQQATINAWQECVRTGSNWYRELRILGLHAEYHPVLAQGVPMRDDAGNITGWAGINLDISRLKQTEAALLEADQRKDEFLATLAHELRNPLAPISHAVKVLTTPLIALSQQQWARDVITRQVNHMTLLLDDLLDVSRITRSRLELKKANVDLKSLITTAIETSRPLIDSKHHLLKTVLPAEPVMLAVDPLRMGQAITNLLMNAAKYTDMGGQITLTVTIEATALNIAIQDTGIGISAAVIPKVFEMFSQAESAIDRSEGGLGIGLALVKGMVSLHGGTVEAVSSGPGLGSCFTIRLPGSCVITYTAEHNLVSTVAPVEKNLHHSKILVADDNLDAAQCLAFILELSGHEVILAHSGREAVQLAMSEHPQVLILDIGMPEMNGYEVAEYIRQQPQGKHMVMIAVSGWGQHDDKQKAKAAGFNHHFTKPVNSDDLEQWLANYAVQVS